MNNRIIKLNFDNKFNIVSKLNLDKSLLKKSNYKELRNLINREKAK